MSFPLEAGSLMKLEGLRVSFPLEAGSLMELEGLRVSFPLEAGPLMELEGLRECCKLTQHSHQCTVCNRK